MIDLTRLNGKAFFLNSDLIEMVEETPDTLITMTNGKKILVSDSAEIVMDKIVAFRNLCFREVGMRFRRKDEGGSAVFRPELTLHAPVPESGGGNA